MIFGNQDRFAIECHIEFPDDYPVVGYMCIWAANRRIGNIDEFHVIWNPVCSLRGTLRYTGLRRDESLAAATEYEVLRIVEDGVYGSWDEPTYSHERHEAVLYYHQFMICPTESPPFDGELAVLLEQNNAAKFMWRDIDTLQIYEILLENGEYEVVIQEFLDWVNPIIKWDPRRVHLLGTVFVFAGHLHHYTRKGLTRLLGQYGGSVVTAVSPHTDYVITGRLDPLSQEKVDRALLAGAQVVAEEDIRTLLPADLIDDGETAAPSGH